MSVNAGSFTPSPPSSPPSTIDFSLALALWPSEIDNSQRDATTAAARLRQRGAEEEAKENEKHQTPNTKNKEAAADEDRRGRQRGPQTARIETPAG